MKRILWITFVVLIAILLGVGYLVWSTFIQVPTPSNSTPAAVESGYILLNLNPVGTSSALYIFNTKTKVLARSSIQSFTPSISMDGRSVVGVADLKGTHGGIYQYTIQNKSLRLLARSHDTLPRLPQISLNNDQVVFNESTATTSTSAAFFTPSGWNIYLASTSSGARLIAHGMYPHWSPDGSTILYLADDGIRMYNLSSSTNALVWPIQGGKASARMMFTVSRDGTQIAWTNPLYSTITLAHIDSWSPFRMSTIYSMTDVFAFWPIFSPSGNQLAFEQVDWTTNPIQNQQPTNARLTIFDIASHHRSVVTSLSSFDQMALFVTGWADNL